MKPLIASVILGLISNVTPAPRPQVPEVGFPIPKELELVKPIEAPTIAPIAELPLHTPPRPKVADTAGNAYPVEQCTQYVKSKRPDIPNHLGDARGWFNKLAAMGWETGTEPRVGAIGTAGNHVVYVEEVLLGGLVRVSERNYDYNGSFRYNITPASAWRYIY